MSSRYTHKTALLTGWHIHDVHEWHTTRVRRIYLEWRSSIKTFIHLHINAAYMPSRQARCSYLDQTQGYIWRAVILDIGRRYSFLPPGDRTCGIHMEPWRMYQEKMACTWCSMFSPSVTWLWFMIARYVHVLCERGLSLVRDLFDFYVHCNSSPINGALEWRAQGFCDLKDGNWLIWVEWYCPTIMEVVNGNSCRAVVQLVLNLVVSSWPWVFYFFPFSSPL